MYCFIMLLFFSEGLMFNRILLAEFRKDGVEMLLVVIMSAVFIFLWF